MPKKREKITIGKKPKNTNRFHHARLEYRRCLVPVKWQWGGGETKQTKEEKEKKYSYR
jgi:hypothetical protein